MARLIDYTFASDLTEWGTTVVDSGDLAWASGAGLGGTSGGMSFTIDDTTAIYGQTGSLTAPSTDFHVGFYIRDVSLSMGATDDFDLLWYHNAGTLACFLKIIMVSGTRMLRAGINNDAGSFTTGQAALGATGTSGAFYEIHMRKATGVSDNNAFLKVYKDSDQTTPVIDITGVDFYNNWASLLTTFRMGANSGIDAGTSGVFYLDEIEVENTDTWIGPNNSAPVLTSIGNHRAVKGRAKLIAIVPTDVDSNLTKISFACTEAKGDWDCTLSGAASVTTGSKPSHTFEVTGTHAEVVATALTATYTPTISTGSDTACTITITDASSATDSETFTVECYGARVYGTTQAGINSTLATLGITHDTGEACTIEMTSVDSGNRTDVDTSVVTFSANSAPTADAGPNQTVPLGSLVTLDGTGSSDPDMDSLTYAWELISKPSGSSAALSSASASQPTFTVDRLGEYVFGLTVNDGTTNSAQDAVVVTATAAWTNLAIKTSLDVGIHV